MCVSREKNHFSFADSLTNIFKEYKVIVTPSKHRDLTRLQHSLTENKEKNAENPQKKSPKEKSEKTMVH